MNLSSLSNLFTRQNVLPVLSKALQGTQTTSNATSTGGIDAQDSGQLSPFAQMLSMLQQLQQSDPAKYQQVTAQIGTNLENAATAASKAGDTAAASQLRQLATDFTKASKSGQIPNIQDLAEAMGGEGYHQLLAASQANGAQSDPLNPMAIILQTLKSSGITSSSS